jgi:hypothetical protein
MPVITVPIKFDQNEYDEASSLKANGETWPEYLLRLVRENKTQKR